MQSVPPAEEVRPVLHWQVAHSALQAVRLHESGRERQHYSDLSDFFACITVIDKLDHSYTRGAIAADE